MYEVYINFLRIQTYLFSVPRLRIMVGANTLLGETIRETLPEIAKKYKACLPSEAISWEVEFEQCEGDLLEKKYDNPVELYKQGILCRDGGHFNAIFPIEEDAKNFQKEAEEYLQKELPGLLFEISLKKQNSKVSYEPKTKYGNIVELPQFQLCQESKNAVANVKRDKHYISDSVEKRENARDKFYKGESKDIIGLLQKKLPEFYSPKNDTLDFDTICDQEYMAVVHIDGNSMGKRYKKWREKEVKANSLQQEMHGERFWFSMRSLFRKALCQSLKETFDNCDIKQTAPYQLLMLGGDDLLMVCRASYALTFVLKFAEALQEELLVDKYPLTIGAGVVISAPDFPFHKLHDMAEKLAKSAKYLNVGKGENYQDYVSAVDWGVVTSSWSDDLISVRQSTSQISYSVNGNSETILLTGKPYSIMDKGEESLQSLLENVEKIKSNEKKIARSQIRSLAYLLKHGRRYAQLLLDELPESTHEELKKLGYNNLWKKIPNTCFWKTSFADLVEIYEIAKLGRNKNVTQ